MAKTYWVTFGSNGASFTGLTPTFTVFQLGSGTTLTPPGITTRISATGAYQFSYDSNGLTSPIFFQIDGGASLAVASRYIQGSLDPVDAIDERIGTTTDVYGSASVDPTTIYGYVKRLQELQEGNASFNKTSGVWTVQSRSGATTLATKTLSNGSTLVSKA